MLVSATPAREQTLEIAVHTGITDTAEQWLSQAEEVLSEAGQTSPDERREAHETWWDEFWGRSWIRVSGPAPSSRMTSNDLPLRIGADSDGANQFRGHIREVRVLDRALTGPEIAALAAGDPLVNRSGLLIDWALDGPSWETAAATARRQSRWMAHPGRLPPQPPGWTCPGRSWVKWISRWRTACPRRASTARAGSKRRMRAR